MSSPGGQKAFTYDDLARPLTSTLAVAGDPASTAMTVTLGYDALGRVGTIAYPPATLGGGSMPFTVRQGYDATAT